MSALLRLFVIAESLIRAALVGTNQPKRLNRIRSILIALRAKAVGTPTTPGAAWDVVADAYKEGAREARRGSGDDASSSLGPRHQDSAQRLFAALASRLDAAIAHVMRDVEGQLNVNTDEIPEVKGFTDKAGRRWDLANYARMCARTTAAEARTEAVVNRLQDEGLDLVRVSKHPHPHDVCSKYEGRVYSISGVSAVYPRLKERPPFHPNCKHVLFAYRGSAS
jgi:hypothetical protein